MHLLLTLLLLGAQANADGVSMYADRSAAVRLEPREDAQAAFTLMEREKVLVSGPEGKFSKIRFRRGGRVVTGFVLTEDLRAKREPESDRGWAIALGPVQSRLSQNGRTFQTEDEVTYTTSAYTSRTVSPFLYLQFQRQDFWRAFAGYRTVRFTGSAKTDIPGSPSHPVELSYNLMALGFHRAWTPLTFFKPFYMGFGGEIAKANSIVLKMDGVDLPTAAKDLPFYMGLQGLIGLQLFLGRRFSLSAEVRTGSYLNQSVPVFETETALAIAIWR